MKLLFGSRKKIDENNRIGSEMMVIIRIYYVLIRIVCIVVAEGVGDR